MDQNHYFFNLVQSFTFQLKTSARVSTDLVFFFHTNERRKSETKDCIYNTDLNFRSSFSGTQCTFCRVNMI